jgi:hypothetical protein
MSTAIPNSIRVLATRLDDDEYHILLRGGNGDWFSAGTIFTDTLEAVIGQDNRQKVSANSTHYYEFSIDVTLTAIGTAQQVKEG